MTGAGTTATRHPLPQFFFETRQPDIDLGPGTPPALARIDVAKVKNSTLQAGQYSLG